MKRILICGLLGLGWALAVQADTVYRWKDASGQVNYGTQPPPGVQAEPIGGRGSVSVMPALPPSAVPQADPNAGRIERLERELEEERRMRREASAREEEDAERRAEARERCEREYREPCDEDGRPLSTRYIAVPVAPPYQPYYPPPHAGRPGDGKPGGGHPGRPGGDHGGKPGDRPGGKPGDRPGDKPGAKTSGGAVVPGSVLYRSGGAAAAPRRDEERH